MHYVWNLSQSQRLAAHPRVDRRGLPRVRRQWAGRRVAVQWTYTRGHAWERGDHRVTYGVLSPKQDGDVVTIEHENGTATRVHYKRVNAVWDLTETVRGGQ